MVDVMSVHEYSLALTETRLAQSQFIASERAAARQALARLRTAQGVVEQRRRAQTTAERLLRTAVEAERIAQLAMLGKASGEPESVGRARLIAATAEVYGIKPSEVRYHKKRPRGRPKTTTHGLTMYGRHKCRCNICVAAKRAAYERERERAKKA
jgi:hypothetical protein